MAINTLKIRKYQPLVNQSNSRNVFFETNYSFLLDCINKRLVIIIISLFLIGFTSEISAQGCDYLPGAVILTQSPNSNPTFYSTAFFIVEANQDTILQVNTTAPTFLNLKRGFYEAYAVTYKTRDSILNLEIGNALQNITSNCLSFSAPYAFSVCSPPMLDNLEDSSLEVCADNNTTIQLTDSLTFNDLDDGLDTFSLFISIIESPDVANDTLNVDLTPFTGLTKSFNAGQLIIQNVRSTLQTQAIFRAVYFYSSSKIKGNRKIEFQVADGISLSNTPNRTIIVSPLPTAPIQIFRKRNE